jgi:hypothetical protein
MGKNVPSERRPSWVAGEQDIRFNCRTTVYPDGSRSVLVADRDIFRAPGWELQGKPRARGGVADAPPDLAELSGYALERMDAEDRKRAETSAQRAQRRAKAAVRDLARSNDFRWFVTLTLSPEKVDRYDVREITRRLNHWADNHVRRRGLAYVLVPERHQDGAIHFHGLFNDALEAVDSGHRDSGGHRVYNLPEWDLGFTTAIELYGDRQAAIAYVCKYIGKQMGADGTPGKVGGRWYYSGGALRRPEVVYCDVEAEQFDDQGYSFTIEALNCRCRKFDLTGGETDG